MPNLIKTAATLVTQPEHLVMVTAVASEERSIP
jgi:hypothetical protein